MSTVQTLIDDAMTDNNLDLNQYPAAKAILDFNKVYHQIEDFITSAIGEGYFWDILASDTTVIGQSEYTIPVLSTGNFNGMPKIEGLSIKYGTDYIPATEVNRSQLLHEHDLSWYETNQSIADPIYFIADNSYFVYPAPTVAVVDGIRLYGIKSLIDVTATTTYADLFGGKIPSKYFYLLSEGMYQYMKKVQGKDIEARNARLEFENEKLPKLIERLGNRKVGISERGTPNLSKYK